MTKSAPVNIGRNIAIRIMLEKAFEVLELVTEPLELWLITDLAPELRDFYPPNGEKLMKLALGQLTRNCRVQLKPDHLIVSLDGETCVKLPYHAIYCIATAGVFAKDLNWVRVKDGELDIAHINLVSEQHGIPKYAR